MSHDFAKKKAAKSPKKRGATAPKAGAPRRLPGWVYFFSGVAITLFGQFLVELARVDTSGQGDLEPTARPNIRWIDENADSSNAEQEPASKRPTLKFYDTLKEMEVEVSDEVVAQREQADYNYALQAGSFKKMQDADQLRAEIILMGLDVNIEQRVSKESGTTWHRVIVGPFTSRSSLAKARSMLANNDIRTIKIKRN